MEAPKESIAAFIKAQDVQFVIPVYQRNYDWGEADCRQLLEDVRHAGRDGAGEHFVGSIIYQEEKEGALTKRVIIDGQQRLTTVSLLYLAIANAYKTNRASESMRVRNQYLVNEYASDDEEKIKLRRYDDNAGALRSLLDHGSVDASKGYYRLADNYRLFQGDITENNAPLIEEGLRKLYFVKIKLGKEDDAQKIFESMNATGVALTQSDLIRNYILMNLSFAEQERIYRCYWAPIEDAARLKENNENRVTEFVRHYMTLEEAEIPTLKRVYRIFKGKYQSAHPGRNGKIAEAMESSLKDMSKYARFYGKILNPDAETHPKIRAHLRHIQSLGVDVCHPLLLSVYNDYESGRIDADVFVGVLELIQSYVIRRSIVGLPTAGNNKTFKSLLATLRKAAPKNYLQHAQAWLIRRMTSQRFPDDSEVHAGLKSRDVYNFQQRQYFFERLENHGDTTENIDFDGLTIEHIFPQKPAKGWRELLKDEEMKQMQLRLHTVANLTLSLNNGPLGNKTFAEKRDMTAKDGSGLGYQYSKLWLNEDLAKLEKWNLSAMDARLARMQSRFCSIWPFPQIPRDDSGELEGVNFSDIPATELPEAVSAFVFLGEKKEAKSARDIYVGVVEMLFALDREQFDGGDLGKIISITRNPPKGYKELPDGWFFKVIGTNSHQWNRIRDILETAGLPDDLRLIIPDKPADCPLLKNGN